MVKYLIAFLLLPSVAFAEQWICYEPLSGKIERKYQGDCLNVGICTGFNNTQIIPNCIEATLEEWNKSNQQYVKYDGNVVSGSRIVDMSQAEIDAIVAAQAQAVATAEAIRVSNLDTVISNAKVADYNLTKIDLAIDNIANLTDAKAFLKRLVRAIVALEKEGL